jgi:hypothetical protein
MENKIYFEDPKPYTEEKILNTLQTARIDKHARVISKRQYR